MGCSTYFNTEVRISRELYDDIQDVYNDIDESERFIETLTNKIVVLAIADPNTILTENERKEGWSIAEFKRNKIRELLKEISEETFHLQRLYLCANEGEKDWSNIHKDGY